MSRLRWHYRSTHESLITFSNVTFYDSELNTFPSVETDSQTLGLRFEFVPEGVYEGSGLNRAEARRVVDAIVETRRAVPELSLGVGTFNLRQQLASKTRSRSDVVTTRPSRTSLRRRDRKASSSRT